MAPALEIRAGASLPGGTYRLGTDRHTRLLAALGAAAPSDGSVHPMAVWNMALGGAGVTIEALFAAAGVAMEDGPMLGALDVELREPLWAATRYAVRGTIVDLERKHGRRLGRFDILRIRLDLVAPGGAAAAACTASLVLPRRDGGA